VVYQYILDGGPWMWPIVAVSVLGLAFILERGWFWLVLWLRKDSRLRRRLVHGEPPAPGLRTGDAHAAVLIDLAQHPDDPELALDRARMLVRDSKSHLKAIAIASSLGSSLGLFGTVVGMSASFGGVGIGDPGVIVKGLQTALNTTVLGLLVYLATYVAHSLFLQLSQNLGADLEEDLNEARRAIVARRAASPAGL
jgi:biopolymer transport protein ExbB